MFRKSFTTLSLALTIVLGLSSCASMQSGTTQLVKVNSVPEGATVYLLVRSKKGEVANKLQMGVTPIELRVARKDGVVLLEKEGYKPVEVPLQRKMNPWVWGDIALTSPLSTSIDTSTGAAQEFDPNEYLVELQAVDADGTAEPEQEKAGDQKDEAESSAE